MIQNTLSYLHNFIVQLVANPADTAEIEAKKVILAGIYLASIPYVLGMALLLVYLHEWDGLAVAVGQILWLLAMPFLFPRLNKPLAWWSRVSGAVTIVSLLLYTITLGGLENSGYVLILFGVLNPMIAFMNLSQREAVIWLIIHITAVGAVIYLQPYFAAPPLPPTILNALLFLAALVSSLLYFGAFVYFINQRNHAFRLLEVEQNKSEMLLLNILPEEIAWALKNNKPDIIADYYPHASVLFADVVDFTPLSAQITAVELVTLLNEVFSYLDTLVEKYGLEKIKTIGDCYMVAAGVPGPRPDHAQAIVLMALELQTYVQQTLFQGKQLAFRIGIHSGPVVAGVIGSKKFIYDLWGDTVNTASRMESHGRGGQIQITAATYELIQNEFVCEPQGVIQVKGKGEIGVWHVAGQHLGVAGQHLG